MTDMTLARIQELNEKRTQGEWRWMTSNYTELETMNSEGQGLFNVVDVWHNGGCGCRTACELEVTIATDDAEFIAHAPAMIDHLLGVVDRLRERHKPVEVEPSETICVECSNQLPNGRYMPVVEYPCPTMQAIGDE